MTQFSLGMISCWGIHHLDIAQWGNGTDATGPSAVEGAGEFPREGAFDAIERWRVRFEYANAAPVVFGSDGTLGFTNGLRFVGSSGWVYVVRGDITAHDEKFLDVPENKVGTMPIKLAISGDHTRDFLDAIRNGPTGDLRHRNRRAIRHLVPDCLDRGETGPQTALESANRAVSER